MSSIPASSSDCTAARPTLRFPFDNSIARWPGRFYARLEPTSVAAPRLIVLNHTLAAQLGLGLEPFDADTLAAFFSGNRLPEGAEPIALAYAGHQFGHFVSQLGDGRALLLGEIRAPDGRRYDLQLKGSGPTPFSRDGDGRAALGPVLREYLVSEAMHALGIPTTRALAAVLTGERVYRERPLPGAVLTRIAASHIRVGTFEYFAARGDLEAVRTLADFVIERHYPELAAEADRYVLLLRAVAGRHARLVAQWMGVGFVHGVMNTDNMAVSGETLDFGPCAFLDVFDPRTAFSSIDSFGRYAYGRQPAAAQWNLARFAETLLELIDADRERAIARATETVAAFTSEFEAAWQATMRAKLGLVRVETEDAALIADWLELLRTEGADFTLSFRELCTAAAAHPAEEDAVAAQSPGAALAARSGYQTWLARWRARGAREPGSTAERAARMRRHNPAYIPRNHRIEAVIAAAVEREDLAPFHTLLDVLGQPYLERPGLERFCELPRPEERVLRTFCGT